MIDINNRRYLGNKYKLLPFIKEIINKECPDIDVIFDVFAGTGAVASAFLDKTIIVNDILYSNHLSHLTWFSAMKYDSNKIEELIRSYNQIGDNLDDNYMSINFANTYFSENTCKKIGFIREDIEKKYKEELINSRERAILVTSLLYAMDKIANTCGHYDAYRKGAIYNDKFVMELPNIKKNLSYKNKCYNVDSNKLVKDVFCDLAYLDPPYNSRQYCDAYHLLENVARWEKPKVKGIAKKMDRTSLKSEYCTKKATIAFEKLIKNLNCKYILLSYNNTANTANDRSNAKISDKDIIRILRNKGEVKVFSKSYKAFTTGKSQNKDNEERLFLCIVKKRSDYIASPLNYTGGKNKLLSQITPMFPKNIDKFVDLFCGGCNVGINVEANQHYYNDINKELIGLFKRFYRLNENTIFNKINDFIEKYNLSKSSIKGYDFYDCDSNKGLGKYNKEKYLKLREDFNNIGFKNNNYFIMFYVLIIYAFNNQIRFNSQGKFNLPVGKRDFNLKIQFKLREFINRLKKQEVYFSSIDYKKFNIDILTENSLVYCDPPYLITTATYNENGGWTEEDEYQLLKFLDKLNDNNIKFALSNVLNHKGKTNEILKEWIDKNKEKYIVNFLDYNYSNSNYQTKDKVGKSEEVLITNYRM